MFSRDPKLKDGQRRVSFIWPGAYFIEKARNGYWEKEVEPNEASSSAYRTYPTASLAHHAMKRLDEISAPQPQ